MKEKKRGYIWFPIKIEGKYKEKKIRRAHKKSEEKLKLNLNLINYYYLLLQTHFLILLIDIKIK